MPDVVKNGVVVCGVVEVDAEGDGLTEEDRDIVFSLTLDDRTMTEELKTLVDVRTRDEGASVGVEKLVCVAEVVEITTRVVGGIVT